MSSLSAHLSIFAVSFLAATILPDSSEVLLIALLLDRPSDSITLLAVATIGNTQGSVINWVLGRAFRHFADRRWFPVSQSDVSLSQQELETALGIALDRYEPSRHGTLHYAQVCMAHDASDWSAVAEFLELSGPRIKELSDRRAIGAATMDFHLPFGTTRSRPRRRCRRG
jgi:hypothetical protein